MEKGPSVLLMALLICSSRSFSASWVPRNEALCFLQMPSLYTQPLLFSSSPLSLPSPPHSLFSSSTSAPSTFFSPSSFSSFFYPPLSSLLFFLQFFLPLLLLLLFSFFPKADLYVCVTCILATCKNLRQLLLG